MNQSVLVKRVRISDMILKVLIYLAASISILLLVGIMCYTFIRGFSSISLEFLTTVPSTLKGTFGIAGNLLNTLYIVLITLLFATPIGVGSAIYLNEYAKPGIPASPPSFSVCSEWCSSGPPCAWAIPF